MRYDIAADAQWIIRRWADLLDYREPGTPRPWRQQTGPGQPSTAEDTTPAPLDLDTLDLIHRITTTTRNLANTIAHTLDEHPPKPTQHPGPQLRYITARHPHTPELLQARAEHTIHRIRARMTEQFAENPDGQLLRTDCPWCHRPGLRIRLIGPEHHQQPAVVCEHDGCNPSPAQCGLWWRGRPAWPLHEWEWLNTNMRA
jgi:hypothetical protein